MTPLVQDLSPLLAALLVVTVACFVRTWPVPAHGVVCGNCTTQPNSSIPMHARSSGFSMIRPRPLC